MAAPVVTGCVRSVSPFLGVAIALVWTGCGVGAVPALGASPAPPAASPAVRGAALATDQPCAPVTSVEAIEPAGMAPQELEGMVLDRVALEAAGTDWGPDVFNTGYVDDAEFALFGAFAGTGVCDLLVRTGRLTGYASAWESWGADDSYARRASEVHLFGTAEGAQAFVDWLPQAAQRMDDATSDLTERVAWFRDGSVVGVVTDVSAADSAPVLDLQEAIAAQALLVHSDGTGLPFDVTALLSVGLPLADWGAVGDGLTWDFYFGGCWDRFESAQQGSQSDAEFNALMARYEERGLLLRCSAMFSPPEGMGTAGLVRIASNVVAFEDAEGAAAYWADTQAKNAAESGAALETFAVPEVPGAIGTRRPVPGADYTDTRVSFQLGSALLTVFIHDQRPDVDHRADVISAAVALAERAHVVLGPVPSPSPS